MALLVVAAGCGSSSGAPDSGGAGATTGTTPAPNTLALTVDSGPATVQYVNGLFATVTLCVPGTTSCQTFDHLLVDTGSVGVRVLASLVTLPLPDVTDSAGQQLVECLPFIEGTAWGPMALADVKLGDETAASLPIQLIGDDRFGIPASCTGTPITDLQSLAANGVLGVGVYAQDCGLSCAQAVTSRANPGLYYACTSAAACAVTAVAVTQQVSHPVASFPVDNNGTLIQLPTISGAGAPLVVGTMTFGIGTQTNNGLGSATVLPLDDMGMIGTTFPVGGTTYAGYLDTGSNAFYFLDSGTTNLPLCGGRLNDFYCPTAATGFSAVMSTTGGPHTTVSFSVGDAATLSGTNSAFADLGGPMPGFPTDAASPGFDWGLPFFFGRTVYTAIEDRGTPAGPYFAF